MRGNLSFGYSYCRCRGRFLGLWNLSRANSLTSPTPVEINYTVSNELFANPNWIAEGCVTATVTLERETNINQSLTVPLIISGSATNEVDYTGIPNSITFNPGQTQVSFTISVVLEWN